MNKLLTTFHRIILIFFVAGVTLIAVNFNSFLTSFKPAISFEQLLDGETVEKGSHIAGTVLFAMPPFASESTYTEHKDGSITEEKPSGNYYVLMTADGYIALKTNQAMVEEMDQLVDETYEYLIGGPEPTTQVYAEGQVITMEDELLGYYQEYMLEYGFTQGEIDALGEPLVIDYVAFNQVRMMVAGGIVLILVAAIMAIKSYKNYIEQKETYTEEQLQSAEHTEQQEDRYY